VIRARSSVQLAAVLTATTVSAPALAASPNPADHIKPFEDSPALRALPERWAPMLDEFDVPGVAVVAFDGDNVYGWFAGLRDPEAKLPVDVDTMFYIASATKTFTAASICTLADRGKIDLDAPVRKYLPRFTLPDSGRDASITVEDLLCHRAALSCEGAVLLDTYTGEVTDGRYFEMFQRFGDAGPETHYANENFTLAGRVVEAVSGKDWRQYMVANVLTPLGMTRTTPYASQAYGDPNVAFPCEIDRRSGRWTRVPVKTDQTMHAAGGLMCSGRDAARWMRHAAGLEPQLYSGALGERSRSLIAASDEDPGTVLKIDGYGLAWMVGSFNGRKLVEHGGDFTGAHSDLTILPDDRVGVAVLMNSSNPARAFANVATIETLEALTGTKASTSAYPFHSDIWKKRRAEGKVPDNVFVYTPVMIADLPGREKCLGTYESELFGTLRLEREGKRVRTHFGQMELQIKPTEQGFTMIGPIGDGMPAMFDVGPDGRVEAIRFPIDATAVFRRVK